MEEIWKDVVGYEGLYQVSNKGNIRSKDRLYNTPYLKNVQVVIRKGTSIKPRPDRYGYLTVRLKKNSKGKTFTIHKLVALAFIENVSGKTCIDHINGNRTDNRVENLRWVTIKENQNNPITKKRLSECKIGAKHHFFGKNLSKEHSQKIGNANKNGKCSIPVIQLDLDFNFIKEYPSTNEVERQTGICHGGIWRAIKNQSTAGGYRWVYKRDYKP